MNIILGIITLVVTFSLVIIIEKLFKKEGLFVWISMATIVANILVCKSISVLGFTTNLGIILFASNFLATDIMNEKYGSEFSKKAIIMGGCFQVIFIIITQLALLYVPSDIDQVSESMKTLFSINLRVSIASLTMYIVSNLLDIYIFEKIKKKIPGKLWLRNNVATIVSNCLENYLFIFLAFVFIYDINTILAIATVSSVIEMIIAIADTPFLYLAVGKKKQESIIKE